MKLNTRLFYLTLFTQFLFAQITGTVTDKKSGEPILGVNVVAEEKGTSTNERGEFQLDMPGGTNLEFSHIGYQTQTIKVHNNMSVAMVETVIKSKEVIVRAGLSDESLQKVASSVTVFTGDYLRETGADHFQSITEQIPNLTWAGGTSRPRYFQIRGIGERSHYFGEGPPNFSVGFVMDDMDLSGLGMVGLLYDLDQIEIFKGPQSSVYGPNAISGLISLMSTDPTDHFEMRMSTSFGSDNHYSGSSVVNVHIMRNMNLRLTGVYNYSDGFRNNVSQNITDSNKREEAFFRMKLSYDPSNRLSILATLIYSELDNGYDAWAPDNNTDFKTYSNDKGEDGQRTYGYSLRANFEASESLNIASITSFTETELVHAYDGDWADSLYWAIHHDWTPNSFPDDFYPYQFFNKNEKNRANLTQEIRFSFDQIIIGGYLKHLKEQDEATGYLFGGIATDAWSAYDFKEMAGYAQYEHDLSPILRLKANVRLEQNTMDYEGISEGINENWEKVELPPVEFKVEHSMLGYRSSIHYLKDAFTSFYGSVSQGYKSGGVNQLPYLSDASRSFDPEFIQNFEVGFKHLTNDYRSQLTAFYGNRTGQQVSVSSQQVEGDPNSFLYYTGNAGSGTNQGFEWEHKHKLSRSINLNASIGYLETWVDKFVYYAAEGIESFGGDRSAATSPKFSGSLGFKYENGSGLLATVNMSYKDEYYFSDSHDEKSEPYSLLDLTVGKSFRKATATFWIKNVLDELYATRGFYFGLIPPDYPDQLWKSYGDPRKAGVTMDYNF